MKRADEAGEVKATGQDALAARAAEVEVAKQVRCWNNGPVSELMRVLWKS